VTHHRSQLRHRGLGLLRAGFLMVSLLVAVGLGGCTTTGSGPSNLGLRPHGATPHPHAQWVKGRWTYQSGHYHWVKGHWRL